jgi:transposase
MRGSDIKQDAMFHYFKLEDMVPAQHPLRAIRRLMDDCLAQQSAYFDGLYAPVGRASIPPEQLLRALLLQALHSIRSEIQLMEQVKFNMLYRWFVGLNPDEAVWDVSVFTKNRDRLIAAEVSERLLSSVVEKARAAKLLSEEHFTVDGTLIQAWANRRSFHPKDPNDVTGTGARGRKLLRDKVESTTDPQARLYCKGGPSMACYIGHVLIENRNGLVVEACATQASSTAERQAGLAMLDRMKNKRGKLEQATLGADTAYQKQEFVEGLRERGIAPHVCEYEPNPNFPNFLTDDERQDARFAISQRKRKLVEKVFGWGKQQRSVKQTKMRGVERVDWMFRLTMAAHNLVRMVKLIPEPSPVLA